MNSPDLANAHVFVDGELVSREVQRIVEAIRDYEPELEVKWIPPSARKEGDAAFAIVHNPRNQAPYVMFYVQKDEDFNEKVLQKIIFNDQRNGKHQWDEFSSWEETQRLLNKQKWLDQMEEINDISAHILKTNLNTYKVNPDLVIQEGIPFNVARNFRKRHIS